MTARLILLLVTLFACGAAQAAAPHIAGHLDQPRMAGQGTFTWFGLKIYDAELWVGEKGFQAAAPFVLELRYARRLDGVKIAEESAAQMAKIGAGSPAQRAAWLTRMKQIFPDVQDGSRISGVFLPAAGVRFYLDGKPLASVPDPQFARAFFAIWLDQKTSASKLRTALLKDAAPR